MKYFINNATLGKLCTAHIIIGAILIQQIPFAIASSWNPALLVNTEAFQVIDDQDTSSDISIRFGDSIAKSLTYDRSATRFSFDDDLYISGNITASGVFINQDTNAISFTIDSEATTQPAMAIDAFGDSNSPHLLFGENGLFDTNLFREAANTLRTDDAFIADTLSGSTVHASNNLQSSGSLVVESDATVNGSLFVPTNGAAIKLGSATSNLGLFESGNGATWKSPEAAVVSIDVNNNDTTAYFAVAANTGNTYGNAGSRPNDTDGIFIVDEGGRVGIQTMNPETELEVVGTISGSSIAGMGLTDCKASGDKLLWDSTTGQFVCGSDRLTTSVVKSADEIVTASTAFQDDDELKFAVGANQTWIYRFMLQTDTPGAADFKAQITAPAGSTCDVQFINPEFAATNANRSCSQTSGNMAGNNGDDSIEVTGVVTTVAAGTVTLQWAQNTSNGGNTRIFAGSFMYAYRVDGADVAEIYHANDTTIESGDMVSIEPSLTAGVRKSSGQYDSMALGIVSTEPGIVLGNIADWNGQIPVVVALSGRVPVKVSPENGAIKTGDYLAASSIPGVAMKATKAGQVIGQALQDYSGNTIAQIQVFIKPTYFPGLGNTIVELEQRLKILEEKVSKEK